MSSEPIPPNPRRRRLTLRVAMLAILVIALGLGGYGEVRRQLAGRALAESLSAPTAGSTALDEVKRLHAEKAAAGWIAAAIREDREARRHGSPPLPAFGSGATRLLKALGPDALPAVPELILSAKGDPSSPMRMYAIYALAPFVDSDDRAFDAMVDLLRTAPETPGPDVELSAEIFTALGSAATRQPALASTLLGLVDSRQVGRRDLAIRLLGLMGDRAKPAVPALIRSLRSPDPSTRGWAARTLASIGAPDDSTISALRAIERDENQFVQEVARDALVSFNHRLENARRHAELQRIIAYDRSLGGKPRPRTSTDASAAPPGSAPDPKNSGGARDGSLR